jgi:branched-chain amino acid transport system ATP-binding protein
MLTVRSLRAGYEETQVLFDLSLEIGAGQVVSLLGRNGMGKTTAVRAIMGLIPVWGGDVTFNGHALAGSRPDRVARLGIGLVPEGRQIFPNLTVEENLIATAAHRGAGPARWTVDRVWTLFPRLLDRRRQSGATLSGGEQQMLAIGRALMTNPSLLILDEATEGLAPVIRAEIWSVLAGLKQDGLAILLIDKNLAAVRRLADRHVIVEKGRVVWSGDSAGLAASPDLLETYLHV